MEYVYIVRYEWESAKSLDNEIHAYRNYDDAICKYNELLEHELQVGSVAPQAFDENGKLRDKYRLYESKSGLGEQSWYLCYIGEPDIEAFIELLRIELH